MKKDKILVGQVRNTNEGGNFTILRVNSAKDITIKHNDEFGHVAKVRADQVRNGVIRNPYYPTLYGVAYMGVGKHKSKIKGKNVPQYGTWTKAIFRCYSEKCLVKYPTYKGCSVSKDWLCFQNFAEWITNHESFGLGYDLDKDLLIKGNKIYSPETCCLIPRELNCFLTSNKAKRGYFPVGVTRKNKKFVAQLSGADKKLLGVFSCPEQAFQAYKIAKEDKAKQLAKKYKDQIEPRAYEALMRYEVNIDD